MNILDLAEMRLEPEPDSSPKKRNRVVERLTRMIREQLEVRSLVNALQDHPGVDSAFYDDGAIRLFIEGLEAYIRFTAGSMVLINFANSELDLSDFRDNPPGLWQDHLNQGNDGVKAIMPTSKGFLVEIEPTAYTPDLMADALVSVIKRVIYKLNLISDAATPTDSTQS